MNVFYNSKVPTIVIRLECGASLASAKGRRKHEKKHCPNMPKEHNMMGGGSVGAGVHSLFAANPLMGKYLKSILNIFSLLLNLFS